MNVLIKAAATAVAGAVLSLLLKRSAPELGFGLSVAVSLLAAALGLELLGELAEILDTVQSQTGLSAGVVAPVMKCVGVGIVTRLSADMCRDGGQSAIASGVELCGTACAMVVALPLIQSLLEMISQIG
jgi:stage III sporulation protein AD